ncbi:hypothetical protein E6H36_11335 [Candidatus Bathyarchaeota archaeon]|nr:MAG: hypothetical protein E6H36_11335 [Candidatus Bathyarchaeota archaeon]TMI30140.1 MAG: hypothetical protein E6H29_09190 [Candidatus Bathyarchaeota archaeon]
MQAKMCLEIIYPSVDELIETNRRVLREISVKRAVRHRVLSRPKLEAATQKMRAEEGDLYDKAAVLLTELVRGHAFASGVRRTAYVATVSFLRTNDEHPSVAHDPRILTGIREGFYTVEETKDWLRGNAVRQFTRT